MSEEDKGEEKKTVTVQLYFKTQDGPKSVNSYRFEPSELDKLKEDFLNASSGGSKRAGAYNCTVIVEPSQRMRPVMLIVRFEDILYIG